jgi:hypothetical protein
MVETRIEKIPWPLLPPTISKNISKTAERLQCRLYKCAEGNINQRNNN